MTSVQSKNGPFSDWANARWDQPVKLLSAIALWSPVFAKRLDQLKWISPDEIKRIGQRRSREEKSNHPSSSGARRAVAKVQRDQDGVTGSPMEGARDSTVELADPGNPNSLRGDCADLLREWDNWSDADRLVHAFELAGRLIIEKTRIGQPYTLKYAVEEGLGPRLSARH